MLIPYGNCLQTTLPKGFTFYSIELSPDGKLYAVSADHFVQIWYAGSELVLLCQHEIQRGDLSSSKQNRRVQIVWKYDSSQIAAICGEGLITLFNVSYEECVFSSDHSVTNTICLPSCSLGINRVCNLGEYGAPLCACPLEMGFLIGTDQGNLVEVEWSGISRGYPIVAPIMIYLPDLSKDLPSLPEILSVDYNTTLKVISVVLNSGCCILFHIVYNNRINFTGGFVVNAEHCTCARMGSFSHYLAIGHSSGIITVHRLQWVNDSLMPCPELTFDIHRYDDLYPPPTDSYQTVITSLAWNWENDHLAVGYGDRCVAVWNIQENPIYWYSWKRSLPSIEANGCCFSAMGDSLLFTGGASGETDYTLLDQHFLLTRNSLVCKSESLITGYSSKFLMCSSSYDNHSIMPVVIPIAQSFLLNCNWPIVGMSNNNEGTHFLLYTCNDLCLYYQEVDKWILHMSFCKDTSYISAVCWLSDWLVAVAIGSFESPSTVAIRIYQAETMKLMKELKLEGSDSIRVNEMVFDRGYLICLLSSGVYIYTFAPSVKWNEPDLTILPLIGTQSIRLELSTGIPSHVLPVVGQTVKYQSRSRSNSMEMFGVGKDQSEEEEEEVIVDELNSLLLINHNFTADVLDIKTCERKHLSNDVIAAFLLHSTDLPPFAQTSIILYGKHRYNTWLPLLEPHPQVMKGWIGPKQYQFASIPVGFHLSSWSTISIYNSFYRHSNEGELRLDTQCILNSPLLQLIQSSHTTEASMLLDFFYHKHIPALLPALEFMIHSALNHSTPEVLHSTLTFLSAYSIFPQVLIGCLRKQERSTWPYALHNPLDILYLFRIFLNAGQVQFATAIISVLQGIDCVASETFIPHSIHPELSLWCDGKAILDQTHPSLRFLMEVFGWLWGPTDCTEECIAHKAGIELLMVLLLRRQTHGLSDIYRFVLMEENRHEELGHPIPGSFSVDTLLSTFVYSLLEKGMLEFVIEVHYELGFEVKKIPELKSFYVMDYGEVIQRLMHSMNLALPSQECFEDQELMKELINRYRKDRSVCSIQRLIERMDGEFVTDWKLVLYFVTIDMDALISLARQSSEQWNRCVLDIRKSNIEWYCRFVDWIQQMSE